MVLNKMTVLTAKVTTAQPGLRVKLPTWHLPHLAGSKIALLRFKLLTIVSFEWSNVLASQVDILAGHCPFTSCCIGPWNFALFTVSKTLAIRQVTQVMHSYDKRLKFSQINLHLHLANLQVLP